MANQKFTAAKAVVAALGGTLTAVATCLATLAVVLGDDAITVQEYGAVATAVATLAGTIYGVWKTENRPINPPYSGETAGQRGNRLM